MRVFVYEYTCAAAHASEPLAPSLRAEGRAMLDQTATLHDLSTDLERNHKELRRLGNLQLAYRELGSTVPMSSVVQPSSTPAPPAKT